MNIVKRAQNDDTARTKAREMSLEAIKHIKKVNDGLRLIKSVYDSGDTMQELEYAYQDRCTYHMIW